MAVVAMSSQDLSYLRWGRDLFAAGVLRPVDGHKLDSDEEYERYSRKTPSPCPQLH